MKRQWKKPEFKDLSLKYTEFDDFDAMDCYDNGSGQGGFTGWKFYHHRNKKCYFEDGIKQYCCRISC